MAKHKVSELTGPLLDLAVAIAFGVRFVEFSEAEDDGTLCPLPGNTAWIHPETKNLCINGLGSLGRWSPSRDWSQGGPIIPKYRISLDRVKTGAYAAIAPEINKWVYATIEDGSLEILPLIAAMRCLVASVYGDEIELPEMPR